ncbi:MAG: helix-turn-helix domain-containing protein [Lapillicoccus sp.]
MDGLDLTPTLDGVGERLRAVRHQRGGTLAQLSAATGISVSTLSRLESGRRRPTLELLLLIAAAWRVQLDELVGAPPTGDPRIHPRPVQRHGRTFVPLSQQPGGLQAYKILIPPTTDRPARLNSHEGYEWIYVLSGRLRLRLGDQDLVIAPGEVVEFDTRTPHAIEAAPGRGVEILALFGPQGERMHVRGAGSG